MQKTFQETQELYKTFLENTERYIKDTNQNIGPDDVDYFHACMKSAKRIFFTGAGSSIPSALFGALYCSGEMGLSAQFVPTGHILSEKLKNDDLVVLCTQGYNRGDSILVTKKTSQDGAQLIVITGNKESPYTDKACRIFYFSPFPEKLFYRPVGVMTGLEVMMKVLISNFSIDKLLDSYKAGILLKPIFFEEDCRYVVLSSGYGNPIGFNFALALQEGCGLNAVFYDIETYGHGIYVGDQVWKSKGNKLKYIIIDITTNLHLHKAVERILPFIKETKSEYQVLSSQKEIPYVYFEILSHLSKSVFSSNQQYRYDMNNPPGKEENRYYHDEGTYLL